VLRANVEALNLRARAEILQGRVLQYLPNRKADIVFLDPPYDLTAEYKEALSLLGADPPPLVIVQHASRFALEASFGDLVSKRQLRQGDNTLSFYQPARDAAASE
jgi:16S rRNA G966 N2-methylase RsmD